MGFFGDIGKTIGGITSTITNVANAPLNWATNAVGVRNPVQDITNNFNDLNTNLWQQAGNLYDKTSIPGIINNGLFGGNSGGSGGAISAAYNGPQNPWSMNATEQNGKNLQTVNFGAQADGRPNAGPYESIRDASGNVGSQFTLNGGAPVSLNTTAFDKYLGEATGPGMTSAGTAALDAAKLKNTSLLNQASTLAESNKADRISGMQSMGGMDMGSRERILNSSNRDAMRTRLDAMNTGASDIANIKATDALNKMNMLPTAQNMAGQAAQFAQNERGYNTDVSKWNIGNALKDVDGFNAYNQNQYNTAMSGWAANKTADAQARAAAQMGQQGGGFVSNFLSGFGL